MFANPRRPLQEGQGDYTCKIWDADWVGISQLLPKTFKLLQSTPLIVDNVNGRSGGEDIKS